MSSAHSNFLDSDSDSRQSFSSGSSDDGLPTFDVCTPEKRQKVSSASNTNSLTATTSNNPAVITETAGPFPRKLSFSGAYRDQPISYGNNASPKRSQTVSGSPVGAAILSPDRTSGATHLRKSMSSVSYLSKSSSSSSVYSPPPLGSALSASPSGSPLQLVERHEKTLHQNSKLTKKMETLTAVIKSKMEKTSKLEEYREVGGILGLSRELEVRDTCSLSSDGEEELRPSLGARSRQQLKDDDKFFLPLHAPGLPVLVRPANLMSTLSPPSNMSEAELMEACSRGDKEEEEEEEVKNLLCHIVCDRWLVMEYTSRACPMHMWQWLFKVTCLCSDVYIGKAALMNLIGLLDVAGRHGDWPVLVPGPSQVLDVLECLGADRKKLQFEPIAQTESDSGVDGCAASPGLVLAGLTHLFTYLNLVLQCRPSMLSPENLLHIAMVTATLSLDSKLLELSNLDLVGAMSATLLTILATIPDQSWPKSRDLLMDKLQTLSTHHHDCLHICHVLIPSSPRSQELGCSIIRRFLGRMVFSEEEGPDRSGSMKDWEFAWQLVKFYHDKPSSSFDYYSMYSAMSMLSMLVTSSGEMEWPPGKEEEMKSMLSDLSLVRIRDNTDRTERVPIKDLLTYYKLEMDTRKRKKSLRQMNLF